MSKDQGDLFLVRVTDSIQKWEFTVSAPSFTLGRSSESTVAIPLQALSRIHLNFTRTANGEWEFCDNDSANGTYFGNIKLNSGHKYNLNGPLHLRIGISTYISITIETPPPVEHRLPVEIHAPQVFGSENKEADIKAFQTAQSQYTEKLRDLRLEVEALEEKKRHQIELTKSSVEREKSALEEEQRVIQTRSQLEQKIDELLNTKTQLESEIPRIKKTFDDCEESLEQSQRKLHQKQKEESEFAEELKEIKLKRDKEHVELMSLQAQVSTHKAAIETATKEEHEIRLQVQKMNEILRNQNTQVEDLKHLTLKKEQELQKSDLLKLKIEEELIVLKKQETEASDSQKAALHKAEIAQEAYNSIETQRKRSEIVLDTLRAELVAGEDRLRRIREEFSTNEAGINAFKEESQNLVKSIADSKVALSNLQGETAKRSAELEDWTQKERSRLDALFVTLGQKQERELADHKFNVLKEIEAEQSAWTKARAKRRPAEIKEILRASKDLFTAHVGEYLRDPLQLEKARSQYLKDIEEAVQAVFQSAPGAESGGESQTRIKSLLASQPHASNAAKKYWKLRGVQVGAAMACLLFLILVPSIPISIYRAVKNLASQRPASNEFVERVRQARANRPKFLPEQDSVYKNTYSDNLIYLRGYAEFKTDENFKKIWILALNKFLQEKLDMNDRVIVSYISIEGPLITELLQLKSQIKPETQAQDLARMRDYEDSTLPRIVNILNGEKNYSQVREFERDFFVQNGEKLVSP